MYRQINPTDEVSLFEGDRNPSGLGKSQTNKQGEQMKNNNCNWCEKSLENASSFNGVCFDCVNELFKENLKEIEKIHTQIIKESKSKTNKGVA